MPQSYLLGKTIDGAVAATYYGQMTTEHTTDRLLPRRAVEERVGLSRSTIYRLMDEGRFPVPIKIGPGCVRWPAREIEAWIGRLPRARGDKAAAA